MESSRWQTGKGDEKANQAGLESNPTSSFQSQYMEITDFHSQDAMDSDYFQGLLMERFYFSIAKWLPDELQNFHPSGYAGNVRGHEKIMKTNSLFFRPQGTISVDASLILTTESHPSLNAAWSNFIAPQQLQVFELACTHENVFKDPHIKKIVDVILSGRRPPANLQIESTHSKSSNLTLQWISSPLNSQIWQICVDKFALVSFPP